MARITKRTIEVANDALKTIRDYLEGPYADYNPEIIAASWQLQFFIDIAESEMKGCDNNEKI